MKTIRNLVLSLAALFTFVPFAPAQTLILPTTLSAKVADSKTTVIAVTSATSINGPAFPTADQLAATLTYLSVDHELMEVRGISGTNVTVRRGVGGTAATPHVSGALVFMGVSTAFSARKVEVEYAGACTRGTFPADILPKINVVTGIISDCLGGTWVNGSYGSDPSPQFHIPSPDSGGTAYTSLNSTGTTLAATTLYCSEVNLRANKLLTGIAILAGTTVGTDKWYSVLYDSAGNAIVNSALAGATTSGASTFQARAFTSKYYAVGPAQYFACFQTNGTTDTARMVVTGTQDNLLTKGQTGATFGTVPALTVPTTFTTAVGPYVYLY